MVCAANYLVFQSILSTSRKTVFEKDLQVLHQVWFNRINVFTHFFITSFRAHTRVPADSGENTKPVETDSQLEGTDFFPVAPL